MTPSEPDFLKMPNIVLGKILEHSEFKEIFLLRCVCKTFRNFIDENKPDIKLRQLRILATFEGFTLEYSSKEDQITGRSKQIKYRNANRVYFRAPDRPDPAKTILLETPIEKFLEDVGRILNHQKSNLELLDIAVKYMRYTREYSEILNFIQQKLESKPKKMRVFSLKMSALEPSQVLQILPNFDGISAISIQHTLVDAFGGQGYSMDIGQILELNQFKNAKKLDLSVFTVDSKLDNFLHFDEAKLNLKSISVEGLEMLIRKFRSPNSTTQNFEIKYDTFADSQSFFESLGPVWPMETNLCWNIRMPTSPEFVLHLVLSNFYTCYLTFSKTPLSSVPGDSALVLERLVDLPY